MSFKILHTFKVKNKSFTSYKEKNEYKGTNLMYQATEPQKDETRDTVLHTALCLLTFACNMPLSQRVALLTMGI